VKTNRKRLAPSIETFKGGVRIIGLRGHGRGNDDPPKRGEIKGWSKDSRKRMREYLLTHQPVEGLKCYGVTLTVPGPPLEPDKARKLWDHFAKHYIVRNGCGAVWRLEVQTRGSAHWHCLMVGRPKIVGQKIERLLRGWWLKALEILPPWYVHASGSAADREKPATPGCIRHAVNCDNPAMCAWWDVSREPCRAVVELPESMKHLQEAKNYLTERTVLFGHGVATVIHYDDLEKVVLSKWPGAWEFAVDVQGEGMRGAWLRYLQDHATKAKQDQIATGFGRHWGVVGRGRFMESAADREMVFSGEKSFYRFWRVYHRLTRPQMSYRRRREKVPGKFDGRPFSGRSLGWSSNRGIYGSSVWFSKPEVVERLFQWAQIDA
jgi:hypothetical protein